jgi:hypothetical protein
MKQIHLTFPQRIAIWNIVGSFEAPRVGEAATYLRVFDKVRPTDVELRDSQFVREGNSLQWSQGFNGDRDIDLEDEEAAALVKALEAIGPVRIVDAAWILPLVKSLTPVETEVPQ